jgi:hypothetical protein
MTREEAFERAKAAYGTGAYDDATLEFLFPQLKESEDERIRKEMVDWLKSFIGESTPVGYTEHEIRQRIAWLEKQKEDKEELVYRMNGLMQEYIKEGKDEEEQEHRMKCYKLFWDALEDSEFFKKQKEQKSEDEECADFTIYHPLKNGKGEYECIPYSFYGSLTSFSEDKDLIDFLRTCFYTIEECNEWIERQKEQIWIPTDEQRTALGMVLKHSDPDADSTKVLESLLDELTKIANPKVAKWKEKEINRKSKEAIIAEYGHELEEEIEKYHQGYWPNTELGDERLTYSKIAIRNLACHFAEWGAEHLKK